MDGTCTIASRSINTEGGSAALVLTRKQKAIVCGWNRLLLDRADYFCYMPVLNLLLVPLEIQKAGNTPWSHNPESCSIC